MSDKRDRILNSRERLRARHVAKPKAATSMADLNAPRNLYGMAKLPPGQSETRKWPVLDMGVHPEIRPKDFKLKIKGACERLSILSFEELRSGFE